MLFNIGDNISKEFNIDAIIGEDHFGEYYKASDEYGKQYYLHIIYIKNNSHYKSYFDTFKDKILYYNNNLALDKYLIKFKKSYTEVLNDKYLLITVYEEDFFHNSLSKILKWDEERLSINDLNLAREYIPKLSNLLLFIKELKEQDSAFSYFSFFNMFVKNNALVFTMPAFIYLLEKIEKNNINAVYNDLKDLNVFQMAPEIINNYSNLSYKSDIWSFGIILSFLLIGKLPFYFASEAEYIENINRQIFELDLQDIPPKWKKIIGGCLKINPDNRIDIDELIDLFNYNINSEFGNINNEIDIDRFIESWFEFSSDSIELDRLSESKEFELKIKPKFINDKNTSLDKGKEARLIFSSSTLASNNNYRYEIILLPVPKIEIIEKECELKKIGENKWECFIYFKVLNSKICIVDKKLNIGGKDFNINSNKEIDNNIITSGKKYCYTCEIQDEFTLNNPVSAEISLKLLNRKEELRQTFTLIPRDYCKLSIRELEGGQSLRALKGIIHDINLKITSFNNDNIIIDAVYIKNKPDFVKLNYDSQNFQIILTVDTLSKCKPFKDTIVIKYREKIVAELFDKEVNFDFTLELVEIENVQGATAAIDFGTTNSCVVVKHKNEEPKIMELNEAQSVGFIDNFDKESIPSSIIYKSKDEFQIGLIAKRLLFDQGEKNAFYSIKTALGKNKNALLMFDNAQPIEKSFESIARDYIDKLIKNLIIKSGVNFENFIFTHPTKLENKSLNIFKKIVEEVVYKYQPQCSKIEFFDEATSAAMGSLENFANENSSVLVYDFGGGTTDIVYANILRNDIEDPITGEEKVNYYIVPKKFRGYQIGGDDINRIIIDEIIQIVYIKKKLIIPYLDILDTKPYVWTKELIEKVNYNIGRLWNISEFIKRNIKEEEIFNNLFVLEANIYTCTEGILNNPDTWKIDKEGASFDLNELFGKEEDKVKYEDFKNKIYNKIYLKLKKCIDATISIISSINKLENNKKVKLVLTGKASQFPLVKDIFNYYKGKMNEEEFKKKYNFLPDNFDCSFENIIINPISDSAKLKSVVAMGGYKLFVDKNINIHNILTYDVLINSTKIEEGTFKVNNCDLQNIIKEQDKNYAVFYNRINKDVSAPLRIFSKTEFGNDVDYFNQSVSFNAGEAICVYVDVNDNIHYVKFDKNLKEIENKIINAKSN